MRECEWVCANVSILSFLLAWDGFHSNSDTCVTNSERDTHLDACSRMSSALSSLDEEPRQWLHWSRAAKTLVVVVTFYKSWQAAWTHQVRSPVRQKAHLTDRVANECFAPSSFIEPKGRFCSRINDQIFPACDVECIPCGSDELLRPASATSVSDLMSFPECLLIAPTDEGLNWTKADAATSTAGYKTSSQASDYWKPKSEPSPAGCKAPSPDMYVHQHMA